MDKEFLLDYEEGELEERRNFLKSLDEDFEFETDRFPSDNRFPRLAKPVAEVSPRRTGGTESDIWAQVPFCGSLLVPLPPIDMPIFEKALFKVSEIPDIVDFVKERGRLQFALCALPSKYEGLDYLDPILKELKPPLITGLRMHDFVNAQEFSVANEAYSQLAKGRFREAQERAFSRTSLPQSTKRDFLEEHHSWFIFLKAIQHPFINDIENLMIDDPVQALKLLIVAGISIAEPLLDTRSDLRNLSLEDLRREDRYIPARYQHKARLPCEIGRFLIEKRTLAPVNLESCCDMLDNFHFGDLRKIMKALNDGIMSNEYDVVSKNTKELSDILDNIWEEPSIRRCITGIRIGMPIMMAAMGAITGYMTGGAPGAFGGGFLGSLGFQVSDKMVGMLFDGQTTGLSERMAKLRRKSYQTNVYDFKKKYASRLLPPPPKEKS